MTRAPRSTQTSTSSPPRPSTRTFGYSFGALADHGDPLFGGEQRALPDVLADGDNRVVEQRRGAADHVEVALGDRVEGAWADRAPDFWFSHDHLAVLGASPPQIARPLRCMTARLERRLQTARKRKLSRSSICLRLGQTGPGLLPSPVH